MPEIQTEFLEPTADADEEGNYSLIYSDEKAHESFSEIFKEVRDFTDDPLPGCHLVITEIHL